MAMLATYLRISLAECLVLLPVWKVISSLGSNHGNRAMSSYGLREDEVPPCPTPELLLTPSPAS